MSHGKHLVGTLVLVLGAGAAAGCGEHKSNQQAVTSSASVTSSATKAAPVHYDHYDIAKISAVKNALPQGFAATDIPPDTVSQERLDAPGIGGMTAVAPDVVAPPQCGVVLKPLGRLGVGAKSQGFIANQDQRMVVVMAAQSDKPAQAGPDGCDHVTVTSPDGVSGTVERGPGPAIEGAQTTALTAQTNSGGQSDTMYTALIGDRTLVVVQGEVEPEVAADLLGKAVAALRG